VSTRSFLDVRFTFPGYTFVLFFIFYTYNQLQTFLPLIEGTTYSLIIGILTVLSGAPFGYYVSQLWYVFRDLIEIGIYNNNRKYVEFLHKEGVIKDKLVTTQVLDYLLRIGTIDCPALGDYVRQRWNLYNMMGSSIISMILGIIFGMIFRNHISPYFYNPPLFHEYFIVIIVLFLLLLFNVGMKKLREGHEYMVWIIIRNVVQNKAEWISNFPQEFFAL